MVGIAAVIAAAVLAGCGDRPGDDPAGAAANPEALTELTFAQVDRQLRNMGYSRAPGKDHAAAPMVLNGLKVTSTRYLGAGWPCVSNIVDVYTEVDSGRMVCIWFPWADKSRPAQNAQRRLARRLAVTLVGPCDLFSMTPGQEIALKFDRWRLRRVDAGFMILGPGVGNTPDAAYSGKGDRE